MTDDLGPFRVQVEIWGRISGADNMTCLGTIDYTLEDGQLISEGSFRTSIMDFMAEVQKEMNGVR